MINNTAHGHVSRYLWLLCAGILAWGQPLHAITPKNTSAAPERREVWVPADQLQSILKKDPKAVVLSREQYETLLRDAKLSPKPDEEPPTAAVISSVVCTGIVEGNALRLHVEGKAEVFTDQWATVPFGSASKSLDSLQCDGETAIRCLSEPSKARRRSPLQLLLHGKGTHPFTAEYVFTIQHLENGDNSAELLLPQAMSSLIKIDLPPNVKAWSDKPLVQKPGDKVTSVTLSPTSGDVGAVLWWRATTSGQGGTVPVAQRSRFLYDIDASRVRSEIQITLKASMGDLLGEVDISVPEGAKVLELTGAPVLKWTLSGRKVALTFLPGERRDADFQMVLETPSLQQNAQAELALPMPTVEGVGRVSGAFGLKGSTEVNLREVITGINTERTEGVFGTEIERDPLFVAAYRFDTLPEAPRVRVVRLAPRFETDLDTLVDFRKDSIIIERTVTLHEKDGETFNLAIRFPDNEDILSVKRADGTEPEWRRDGNTVRLEWTDRTSNGKERVFKIVSDATRFDSKQALNWPDIPEKGFPFRVADVSIERTEKVNGYLAIKGDTSFRIEMGEANGLEARDGRLTPVRGDFAWFRGRDFSLNLTVTKRAPEQLARFTGFALPMQDILDVHAQVDYEFRYSGVKTVRLKVPEKQAALFHFEGPQIAERKLDGDIWTLTFQKEITGNYALGITAQLPVFKDAKDSARFTAEVPMITPLDCQRVRGHWAIEANTETEISVKAEGMNELDALPVLPPAGYQPRHRVISIFQFLNSTYALTLSGVRHAAAPMLSTVVDTLALDTVVSTSSMERHQADFALRTAGEQYLEVALPKGSRLWSVTVDGEPVKPVGARADLVRVGLPAKMGEATPVNVRLLYETPKGEWTGSGRQALIAPKLTPGIPILHSQWRVYLPEGYAYRNIESNLRQHTEIVTPLLVADGLETLRGLVTPLGKQGTTVPDDFTGGDPETAEVVDEEAQKNDTPANRSVAALLSDAQGFYDTERYGLAMKRYDQVLAIDSANAAAREGRIKVESARKKYADTAYDESRARALWRTTKAWERPVRRYGKSTSGEASNSTAAIQHKLNSIIIPKVEFKGATVREAVDFLKKKSVELDTAESNPSRRGVNIVLQPDYAEPNKEGISPADAQLTLSVINMPLGEVIRYVTTLSGLKVKVESDKVSIVSQATAAKELITKEYMVPPRLAAGGQPAEDYLKQQGVVFPFGANANFVRSSSSLIVRNTQDNLDLVDAIVDALNPVVDVPKKEEPPNAGTSPSALLKKKLNTLIIPSVEFKDASLREAIYILKKKSAEVDTNEPDPTHRGVNICLQLDEGVANDTRITLSLRNVSLAEVIRHVTNLAGLKMVVDNYAVAMVPLTTVADQLITKEYKVPPGGFNMSPKGSQGVVPAKRQPAKDYFSWSGAEFPPGPVANYIPTSNRLIVKGTQEQHDEIDRLIAAYNTTAGLLPMKLELPLSGEPLIFTGFLAPERVAFTYRDWAGRARLGWIWFTIGAFAFLLVGRSHPWRRMLWAALLLTFIPVCLWASAVDACNSLLAGWLVAFVLHRFAVWFIFRRPKTPTSRTPESHEEVPA